MAPPLQTALVGLLLGIFATDLALGVHELAPFLLSAHDNVSLLKTHIVGSQRTEILALHRTLIGAPLWFWGGLVGAWALLLGVSLFNSATDRKIHLVTFVCAIGCALPILLKYKSSPVPRLRNTSGRFKLSSADELVALYDICFIVVIDTALLLIAFVANLFTNSTAQIAPPKVPKKDDLKKD
ncbi:hypothetical protein HK100_010428 [Physocladia obscura]|uniref:Uncharacterized protein n=1 Tax=Physocladia obscura TaxID=109957 RepID=A0AAD5T478_9FUNG|nr:hypothetical protein HK100_010428 [Physocladia obscura]